MSLVRALLVIGGILTFTGSTKRPRKASAQAHSRAGSVSPPESLAGKVVVLDPGHGGVAIVGGSSPNNATGPSGTLEKNLTLELARRVRTSLERQAPALLVLLTRDSDVNLGLSQRLLFARQHHADLFLSIHFNGFKRPDVQGVEVWLAKNASAPSVALGRAVEAAVVQATGHRRRGVKRQNLEVLYGFHHEPQVAAALVEVSFLTDPAEEARLKQPAYLDRIAEALAAALLQQLGQTVRRAVHGDT